jgi:hypothetical protein
VHIVEISRFRFRKVDGCRVVLVKERRFMVKLVSFFETSRKCITAMFVFMFWLRLFLRANTLTPFLFGYKAKVVPVLN